MSSQTPQTGNISPVASSLRRAIIGPIAANIAFVMELTLVPLLLPAIQSEFDLSIGELAWVFNSYGIAVAVGVLLGGLCGDLFNTRKIFGYGVAFFAIGSTLVALSSSFEMLIIGRALQGLGGGIFSPLFPLLLTRAAPQSPGRVLIMWGSIAGYVAAFAPLFYGSFLGVHGWNIAFICIASIALVALIFLTKSQNSDGHTTQSNPAAKYSDLLKAPNLWATFAYVFCTYGAITYYLFRLPVWLSSNDINAISVGFALSILWLTFSAASTLLRNRVDGPHLRMIMLAAPFLIFVGLLLSNHNESAVLLALSSCLVGTGLACSNAPSTQLVLRFAPKGMSAVSTSLDITFARLGGIATVAILAEAAFSVAVLTICLMCLVAAFCAFITSKELNTTAPP